MTDKNTQSSHSNNISVSQKLAIVFGAGTTLTAVLEPHGKMTFLNETTDDSLGITIPEDLVLFGPGNYQIKVEADHFDFTIMD